MPQNPYSPRSLLGDEFHSLIRVDPHDPRHAPPAALRHNRLAWYAACDVVGALSLHTRTCTPKGDLGDAAAVLRVLVDTRKEPDIAGACEEYCRRWATRRVALPVLQADRGKVTWLNRVGGPRGSVTVMTAFPPALAVWLLLSEPEICKRIRQCPECDTFFLDATRNRSKRHCSTRCTSRATSRDYRAAGKERDGRRKARVTSLGQKSSRR